MIRAAFLSVLFVLGPASARAGTPNTTFGSPTSQIVQPVSISTGVNLTVIPGPNSPTAATQVAISTTLSAIKARADLLATDQSAVAISTTLTAIKTRADLLATEASLASRASETTAVSVSTNLSAVLTRANLLATEVSNISISTHAAAINANTVGLSTTATAILTRANLLGTESTLSTRASETTATTVASNTQATSTAAATTAANTIGLSSTTTAILTRTNLLALDSTAVAISTNASAAVSQLNSIRISSIPVAITNFPAITNGVGTSTAAPVLPLTESSRQTIISSATAVAASATDVIFTLTTSTDFANGTIGTSFGVPSGKIFKITTFQCVWIDSALAVGAGICRLRATSSGTCTATSPIIAEVAITGQNAGVAAARPDRDRDSNVDVNISGTMRFCASHIDAATGPTLDVLIRGYQY